MIFLLYAFSDNKFSDNKDNLKVFYKIFFFLKQELHFVFFKIFTHNKGSKQAC